MIDVLNSKRVLIDANTWFGIGLNSFNPNCVRHTLGILAEASNHVAYRSHLMPYYDDIYCALLNSCMESSTFYAAVCLYNLRPDSIEAKVMYFKWVLIAYL